MTTALVITLLLAGGPTAQVSVDGDGYLRFSRDGRVVYAKEAMLGISEGRLCHQTGVPCAPTITVNGMPTKLEVDLEGNVRGTYAGQPKLLGRLVLATFTGSSPSPDAGGLLIAADRPLLANPGEGAVGVIRMRGASASTSEKAVTNSKTITKPAEIKKPIEPADGVTRISVHALTEVADKQFTLGEIADIQGPKAEQLAAIIVGESPALGVDRGIDKTRIQGRLRMAGINPAGLDIQVPANAKITRQSQKVTNDDFVGKATEAAKTIAGGAELKCVTNQGEMRVPQGQIELIAERTSQNGTNFSVTVAVLIDGKRFNSRTLTLVASPGAGQVKSGTAVRIRVVCNGATVEVAGRTKSAGTIGGPVEVVTLATAQMPATSLTGTLKEPGLVEVKL